MAWAPRQKGKATKIAKKLLTPGFDGSGSQQQIQQPPMQPPTAY